MSAFRKALVPVVVLLWMVTLPVHAASAVSACSDRDCALQWVYFGTRADGAGQGIRAAQFDARTGRLKSLDMVLDITRPTWLQVHPKLPVLYSVSEVGNDGKSDAAVYSLVIDRDTGKLRILNQSGSGGGGATHLDVDARSGTLFVANYGSGSVAALPIRADGSLGAVSSVQQQSGSGPSPRQKGPHAHSVLLDPGGRFLLSADLGADRIYAYRLDPRLHRLTPADPPATEVAPGSGPRHMAFDPAGQLLVLVTELTAELQSYRWDGDRGRLQWLHSVSTASAGFKGIASAAEVTIDRTGRFVYASNRSENMLLVYALEPASGLLTLVQRIDSQGLVPWSLHLDLTGRWLLVANQGSNAVNVFSVNKDSGKLAANPGSLSVPAPSSIAFAAAGAGK